MEDYERNDGSKDRPYFMSDNLKKLLGVKNKFEGTDADAAVDEPLQLEPVTSSEKP